MFFNVSNSDLQIKINSINTKKNIANIELLLFVDKEQTESSFVQFSIIDLDTNFKEKLSNNNYWISDFSSITNNSSNKNVNINYYKKINFYIDVSNNERSFFNGTRWFRRVKIVADLFKPNTEGSYQIVNVNGSWTSELLTLISGEVTVPDIKKIQVNIFNEGASEVTNIKLNYDYGLENDFNYTNSFLYYQLQIKSPFNGKLIASEVLQENGSKDLNSSIGIIEWSFYNLYLDIDSIITVNIRNNNGQLLKTNSIVYTPRKPKNRMYISWQNKIVEVKNIYVNDINEELNDNGDLDIYKNTQGVDYKPTLTQTLSGGLFTTAGFNDTINGGTFNETLIDTLTGGIF